MMDTSTPMPTPLSKKNDLHRRTLLKNAMEASPLRRKSILQIPVNAVDPEDDTNDESERSTRRSLVNMQKRLSNLPQQSPLNESTKFIGEQEMKDHFQICTKLFAANKITPKNAWQLHIIDVLRHMSQKSGDTLQAASTSLDISAKVYGVRVDDIHADGLKLASSMARVSEKETPQQLDEDDGADDHVDGEENAAAKKKKKRKRLTAGQKNTIVKDPATLRGALPKLESVFFSTRTNAESSAIDNLFTNMLPMDNSSYKFMLLSREKAWPDVSDPAVDKDRNPKKYPLKVAPLKDFTICAPFNGFVVDQWDPEEEEKNLASLKEKSDIQRENEVVFDDDGVPLVELDGSIHDIFADENDPEHLMDVEEEQDQPEFCAQICGEVANVLDVKPEDLQKTEYSYAYSSILSTQSGKRIDQIWAGPSHWKVKFIRRSTVKFSGQAILKQAPKTIRKRNRIQLQEINFDDIENMQIDKMKKYKIKKKPSTVDIQKITLPVPEYSTIKLMEHIRELITKPGTQPVRADEVTKTGQDVDYEVSPYNYENPNDSLYCPSKAGDGNDDNDADMGIHDDVFNDNDHEEIAVAGQQNFIGENLVDAPELVPKAYVPYALQAKKMDMKKLKAAVWHSLIDQKGSIKDVNDRKGKVVPKAFSKLYKELPDLLNEKMRNELSCPLAFVALLHLCNDQNLKLVQHSGYKDFDILGPNS